ncbi:MAG: helix-turn-helix domain-containing protein [Chloroflexi bacterium]|nr:helix-turn-helix domain-containing protein [Chloroflexota bacterium]
MRGRPTKLIVMVDKATRQALKNWRCRQRTPVGLACLLLTEWADTGGHVALTQQEMAARVGTAREVINRALRVFERRGAITREHHRIVRVDPCCLRALLGHPVPAT